MSNAARDTPELDPDERRLVAALDARDADVALALLVERHGETVYRYCRRMLGNDADGDDVSQIVFLQAFEGIKGLTRVENARAWLLGIARHRCLDRLRSKRRGLLPVEQETLQSMLDQEAPREASFTDSRARKALDECLDGLEPRSRLVLLLRFHDELSYDEISRLTSDNAGALRVRVTRALPALRDCLESKGVESWP